MVIQNARVSLDLTTELNFDLEKTVLGFEEVIVTADRPLIRKDETNTNIIRNAEDIENLPTHGLQNLAAQIAGVVKEDNSSALNIRGGRSSETAIYIDGVHVNDPYNNAMRLYLPNQAIEEMSVQTGGFNAEYGEAMSGIIAITTNTGSDKYHASFGAITDMFLNPDSKTLGTYSYGYKQYVLTLGGPIIPKRKHTFFLTFTQSNLADHTPSWGWAENPDRLDEYTYNQVITTTALDSLGDAIKDTLVHNYKFNANLPENNFTGLSFSGKIKLQLGKNMQLKSSVVQSDREYANTSPVQFFNTEHRSVSLQHSRSINTTFTHTLSPRTFYDLKLNLFNTETKTYDAVFKDDLEKYGDPKYSPWPDNPDKYGEAYTGRLSPDYFQPGSQYDDYFKQSTTYWGIDFDLTHQQGKYHTFKTGFEYKHHTMRQFRVFSPSKLADPDYANDLEKYRSADVVVYGYDLDGNEVDDGDYFEDVVRDESGRPISGFNKQAPYQPIIMSGYIQDKIEFKDLIINLGLRYDHINPNAWMFKQIEAEFLEDGTYVDGTGMFGGNRIFDKTDIKDSETYSYISPRLGISFPVTDKTIFHAQYGKFYQAPNLADLYLSPFYMDRFVMSGGYFTAIDNPNLRPPKTTSYELGFKQLLGENASLRLTAFYKETEDLVQLLNVTTDITNIAFYGNGDFGQVKGLDIIFDLRRHKNLAATFNYELQFATGTGSASGSNFDIAWQGGARGNFPNFAMPLDFEQRHTGSLNIDYRFSKNDAPIGLLKHVGANLMFSFNSGNPYTRMEVFNTNPFTGRYDNDNVSETPYSAVNAEITPWIYKIDLKVNKAFYFGNTKLNVYASVLNLLNTANVRDIWITTGLPDDTGFRGTAAGQAYWNSLDETGKQLFRMREMDYNNYGTPRQIRLGVDVSL
jgi:outer membrane cobalamin receptor